jgi:hypothetical protein
MTEKQLSMRDQLVRDLDRISMMRGEFIVSEGFIDLWTAWYMQQENNPPFRDSRLSGYIERRPTHLMKLSMIMRAARAGGAEMRIEKCDLEKALRTLTMAERKMQQVFAGIGKSATADTLTKVMAYVAEKKSVSFTELQGAFYRDADSWLLGKIVETLSTMRFLKIEVSAGDRILHHIPKKV